MVGWATKTGKRKIHKERPQPKGQRFLERHSDYQLRARDFGRKKFAIAKLQRKAAQRNPDEFSFKMINSTTDDKGAHKAMRKNTPHSQSTLALYNTQDLAFSNTIKAQLEHKLERYHSSIVEVKDSRRTLYFDKDQARQDFQPSDMPNVLSGELLESQSSVGAIDSHSRKRINREKAKLSQEINALTEHLADVNSEIEKTQFQRNMMKKGPKKLVKTFEDRFGDEDKSKCRIYKWKQVRKRWRQPVMRSAAEQQADIEAQLKNIDEEAKSVAKHPLMPALWRTIEEISLGGIKPDGEQPQKSAVAQKDEKDQKSI